MLQLLLSSRPKSHGLRSFFAATLFLALGLTSVHAQGNGMAGYGALADRSPPGILSSFATNMQSDTIFVIPFSIYEAGNGTYTLNSLYLDLYTGSGTSGSGPAPDPNNPAGGGPGGPGPGGVSSTPLSGFSLQVFSTLPSSLSLPTPLLSFVSDQPTGGPSSAALGFDFFADATPTFTAGTIYYLTLRYAGTTSSGMNWNKTSADSYSYSYPGDIPVTSAVAEGTPLVYYKITSGGVQGYYDQVGGFLINANALTAIPEPAASTALAAGAVLGAVLWMRRRAA